MDQTYAEIENAYAQISTLSPIMTTPKSRRTHQQHPFRSSRHMREHFDSRLPIEYRYPKRNSMTSSLATTRKRSLASKSSSSGYSSSESTSSIKTVVNGCGPYRPKKELAVDESRRSSIRDRKVSEEMIEVASIQNNLIGEESSEEVDEVTVTAEQKRACCIECREKEIRKELDLESHQYANLESLQKPQDPYVFLMTSMLSNLQKDEGGRKVARVQQKIEKVLRLKPREPFNVENKLTFDRQISTFASDVTIRLRAVSDVAPETYREISAKFCDALHHGTPNTKSLKSIVKGVKNLFSL